MKRTGSPTCLNGSAAAVVLGIYTRWFHDDQDDDVVAFGPTMMMMMTKRWMNRHVKGLDGGGGREEIWGAAAVV